MSQLRSGLEPVVPYSPAAELTFAQPTVRAGLLPRALARVSTAALLVGAATIGWSVLFAWLAVTRHMAFGTHAEDLGFTDQVIWNFLRGQWFRMSLYQGASAWNTEIDLAHLARPDSLLAFHVEPMLLGFVPLYALGAGPTLLLVVQAAAVGLGAVAAYRLGQHFAGSPWAGAATALAYLLSPLGQWAVLSDFHTTTLAAPLLLFAAERVLVAGAPRAGIGLAILALSAREDVGPAVALLGVAVWFLGAPRRVGLSLAVLGVLWTAAAAAVLLAYSGGISPFGARYGASTVMSLARPETLAYVGTMLLSGGWLGLLAPVALLPALPTVASNALSASPWMAAGEAHYSGLVLPFVALGAAAGFARLRRVRHGVALASALLVLSAAIAYISAGAGPLAANYAPARVTDHARRAADLLGILPAGAAVSASSTLAPHLSQRARLYLFPAVLDANYIVVDLRASSAPTSPGDVFLHIRDRLASGGWAIQAFDDGVLVVRRDDAAPPLSVSDIPVTWLFGASSSEPPSGALQLLEAELVPSPDGALDVDGPRAHLRTVWRANEPLPPGTRLAFDLELSGPERVHVWDVPALWWYPPERWAVGRPVVVDISGVPARRFLSWQALVSTR